MSNVPSFAWVVIAIIVLVVLAGTYPKLAGTLLIAIVFGMVYKGWKRGALSSGGMTNG